MGPVKAVVLTVEFAGVTVSMMGCRATIAQSTLTLSLHPAPPMRRRLRWKKLWLSMGRTVAAHALLPEPARREEERETSTISTPAPLVVQGRTSYSDQDKWIAPELGVSNGCRDEGLRGRSFNGSASGDKGRIDRRQLHCRGIRFC